MANLSDSILVHVFSDDRGKSRRLIRDHERANWQFRVEVKGKQIIRSMGTPLAPVAVKNAIRLLKSLRAEDWEAVAAMRLQAGKPPVVRVGTVMDLYATKAEGELRIEPRTVSSNVSALKRLLEISGRSDVRALPVSVLADEAVLRDFVRAARALGRPDVSIRSQINQAKSVVCREVRPIFAGMDLPTGLGWPEVAISWRLEDDGFERIDPEILTRMEAAAAELRLEDPELWKIYMLMSRCGLRNSEVVAARWGWLERRADRGTGLAKLVINIRNRAEEGYRVKNDLAGAVDVPVKLAASLEELRGDAAEFVIAARTDTDRHDLCYVRINAWIRQFLPDRTKGAYELRKWAGSEVAAAEGIYAAQQFLRHRSIKTTETYYRAFLAEAKGVDEQKLEAAYSLETNK